MIDPKEKGEEIFYKACMLLPVMTRMFGGESAAVMVALGVIGQMQVDRVAEAGGENAAVFNAVRDYVAGRADEVLATLPLDPAVVAYADKHEIADYTTAEERLREERKVS